MKVGDLKAQVHARDGGCVARRIDPEAGPCRDSTGVIVNYLGPRELEMDYVRYGHHGPRHTLVEDHISLCPGHHRGTGAQAGYQWATVREHRMAARAWLDREGGNHDP